jgi:hypothetical protein
VEKNIRKNIFNGMYAELLTLRTFILWNFENNQLYRTKCQLQTYVCAVSHLYVWEGVVAVYIQFTDNNRSYIYLFFALMDYIYSSNYLKQYIEFTNHFFLFKSKNKKDRHSSRFMLTLQAQNFFAQKKLEGDVATYSTKQWFIY